MNALKGLNKEQWTAAAAGVVGFAIVLFGAVGGGTAGTDGATAASPRGFEPVRHRSADFVPDSLAPGRLFAPETTGRLNPPVFRPPEPREEEPVALFFRPGPATGAYNRSEAVKLRYPVLSKTVFALPAAELPPPAEIDALRNLAEPVAEPRKDRRNEKEHEFFKVQMKNSNTVYEGAADDLGDRFRIKLKGDKPAYVTVNKKDCNLDSILFDDTYAKQYGKRTQKIQPGPKEAAERTALAKWALDLGMVPEARLELGLAVKAKKDHLEAIQMLGALCIEQADHDGALAVYEAGLADGAPVQEMHYEIGRILRAVGPLEAAQGAFEKALDARPGFNAARLALARTLLDLGNSAAALTQAGDVAGRFAGAGLTDALRAESFLLQGMAQLRLGDLAKARRALEGAATLPEGLNALGVVDVLEGNTRAGVSGFARAIAANQYLTEAWVNLGNALLLAGRGAEAEAVFVAAAQRDPASADAQAGQACAQVVAGNAAAAQTLARALALDPRHPAANTLAGLLKMREGAATEASERFTAALREDFDFLPAYSGAAAARLREAQSILDAGGGRDPAKDRRARELRIQAQSLLEEVAMRDAGRGSVRLSLGCAYAAMGRADEARGQFAIAAQAWAGKTPDPLLWYAQGYLDAAFGADPKAEVRLAAARGHFAQGEAAAGITDPAWLRTIEDCRQAREAIDDWMLTEVRAEDAFEREPGPDVKNGWQEIDGLNGISIDLVKTDAGGRVRFSGKQAVNNLGVTALQRDIAAPDFHSLELTFHPEKTEKTEFGISVLSSAVDPVKTGFHFGLDMQGRFRWVAGLQEPMLQGRDMTLNWVDTKLAPPNPKEIQIRVVRAQTKAGAPSAFAILVRDAAKGEWVEAAKAIPVGGAAVQPQWRISIWSRAVMGQDFSFTVDDVKVLERQKR